MYGPREVLNELRWRSEYDLARAEIRYVHRGAPDDTRIVPGSAVRDVGRSFVEMATPEGHATIPMHRIFRIDYDGEPYWKRHPEPWEPVRGPE